MSNLSLNENNQQSSNENNQYLSNSNSNELNTQDFKFCKFCGSKIPYNAVICMSCGRQVEDLKQPNSNIIINNNMTANPNAKNKWLAFVLCILFGFLGIHKFYEGKIIMGVLYFLTFGFFGIGWLIDCIIILLKPNPYYC